MESNNQSPEVSLDLGDVELMKEVVHVLDDTKCPLTQESILALVAIRLQSKILSALEDLMLTGQVEAEVRPDVSDEAGLSVDSYLFRRTSNFTGALTSEKVTRG